MKSLWSIFSELFRISLFVIGGGYSILVVADRRFAKLGWIKEGELIDHLPVFQTVPGLIATHTAVYIGRQRAGKLGALIGVIAVAIPAIAIFTFVAIGYRNFPLDNPWIWSAFIGLRAALTGIIAATIVRSWRKSLPDAFAYALMIAGVLAIGYFQIHIALVLVAAMLLGLATTTASRYHSFSLLPLLLFAQYGALCFGGGFVLVPMYLHDFVGPDAAFLQLAEAEFGDIMALSQMTPGPIGVNCATFFGYRLAGIAGAVFASALLLLPGSVLCYAALSSLERFRTSPIVKGIMRGIRPASIALMLVALFVFARMTVYADGTFRLWGLVLTVITMVLTMSKKINVILLIILCALSASALRAESLPLARVTSAAFPDADTVTVDAREDIEYFPDGTYRSVEETWTKALTEAGRRSLSSDTLDYNQRYGEARFAEVAILTDEFATNVLDLAGLVKDATDNSSTAANIYDPLDRKIVCNIPGVKVGDTVYVRKERATFAARCQNQWANLSVFEDFAPVVRSSLRVKCPASRPLRRVAVRHPLGNLVHSAVTNADGSVVMEWCATNSPQAFYEPSMLTPYRQLQHVCISTAKDWREMSKWYWELCAPHLAKINAAMIAKVIEIENEVEQAAGGREALMRAIFRFVSQEIRYMGLTMEDKSPGYAPHDVDITFDKRYGVCRDKAGLLAAMLRLAGFEAYPVLIMAGSAKMDADVPSPYFNHAIVAVSSSVTNSQQLTTNSYILMDPTAESTKDLLPSYESDCSYLVARPDGETLLTTPMPPADENLLKIESEGRLDAGGSMMLTGDLRFQGLNDTIFRQRFLRMKPTERTQYFEKIVAAAYPEAQLLMLEIKPTKLQDVSVPLSVRLAIRVPDALLRGKTETRLATGWFSKRLGIANMLLSGHTALEQRRFPLRIPSTAGIEERLSITLSDTLGSAVSTPEAVSIAGPYEYALSAALSNGVYTLSRQLKINSLEFSPKEYLDLREQIKSVEAAERRYSAFADNRLANADVRYLLRGGSVDFTGVRSWVTTNTLVKQILTYDGKKENSEFELAYNPLIKRVKVLRASVTSPDGRTTVFAGEKELTELDCSWAASAPRYPASKRLVVTLPSVEIGSVITTVVEAVTTDSPVAFRNRYYLDAVEPTDELRYRIDWEERRVTKPERLAPEKSQPAAHRWRRSFVVDRGTFAATCALLRRAAEVDPLDPSVLNLNLQSRPSPRALRDWMAKHVRVRGPSLYEVPLARQLTAPATVVKERYATRLDYVRTLCALLKGAGFQAEVVFASTLRGDDERYPAAYSEAVCRVDGLFLGLENEYTPLEATALDGHWYLDPVTELENVIHAKGEAMRERDESEVVITVRPDGAVDYDYELGHYGAQVGRFRKTYAEMLPEERSRHYQQIVGGVAQSASATSELVTDIEGYPARLKFSCYIPDYAVVDGDKLSLELAGLEAGFGLTGDVRRSPVGVSRSVPEIERWKIVFPIGYTEVENLPEPLVIHDPTNPSQRWCQTAVTHTIYDGHLEVTITKETFAREEGVIARDYFPLLRDWSRRGTSSAFRTLTIRR